MAYVDRINPSHALHCLLVTDKGFAFADPTLPRSQTPLEDKAERLLNALDSQGYERTFIRRMRNTYAKILQHDIAGKITGYSDLWIKQVGNRYSLIYWAAYDFFDLFPTRERPFPSCYDYLNSHYRHLIDAGMRIALNSGMGARTVNVETSDVAPFLLYLQRKGLASIYGMTESNLRSYMSHSSVHPNIIYRIGLFISRIALRECDVKLMSLVRLFPRQQVVRKVYVGLSSEERVRLEEYIVADDCPLSKRNRAIIALIFYTGIRACDARQLKLSDIDWAKSTIRIRQSKTQVEILLPLRPFVGNCIYDYIKHERPKCDLQECFVSYQKTGSSYSPCNIAHAVISTYRKIGICQKNEKRGTHILRHSFADEMMNSGSDITIVAKTLGHLHPNTTLGYLSANIEQLRQCSLSIEDYPITHKLYCHDTD